MRRLIWLVAGAAGAAAVLVASPETYTRLRERVAGGPVGELMPADEFDYPAPPPPPPPSAPPSAYEPEAAEDEDDDDTDEIHFPPPPPPPPDQETSALRARIGESRERLREKAMAATPESEQDVDEGSADEGGSSPGSEPERDA
jgi:hypothetical protein